MHGKYCILFQSSSWKCERKRKWRFNDSFWCTGKAKVIYSKYPKYNIDHYCFFLGFQIWLMLHKLVCQKTSPLLIFPNFCGEQQSLYYLVFITLEKLMLRGKKKLDFGYLLSWRWKVGAAGEKNDTILPNAEITFHLLLLWERLHFFASFQLERTIN